MSWRAVGCAVLAAAVFVGLGLWALQLALGRPGCPQTLLWGDRIYTSAAAPAASPEAGDGEPVRLGTILVGALSREVYGPEGSSPSLDDTDRPDEVALDCGDGTFVTYRFTSQVPTAPPSP
jgi:hypothetical protein